MGSWPAFDHPDTDLSSRPVRVVLALSDRDLTHRERTNDLFQRRLRHRVYRPDLIRPHRSGWVSTVPAHQTIVLPEAVLD